MVRFDTEYIHDYRFAKSRWASSSNQSGTRLSLPAGFSPRSEILVSTRSVSAGAANNKVDAKVKTYTSAFPLSTCASEHDEYANIFLDVTSFSCAERSRENAPLYALSLPLDDR